MGCNGLGVDQPIDKRVDPLTSELDLDFNILPNN